MKRIIINVFPAAILSEREYMLDVYILWCPRVAGIPWTVR